MSQKLIQLTTNIFQIRDAKDTNQQVRYKFHRKKKTSLLFKALLINGFPQTILLSKKS